MTTVYPYTDIFVRYLLGDEENSDLLLSFINAVNEDYDFPLIKSVTIKNPFNLKKYKLEKGSVIDVKATDEEGRQYDIEVQVSGNEFFKNRSLYYWSKLYSSQLSTGSQYQKLKPTICMNLTNFRTIPTNTIHTCFLLCEMRQRELVLTDHLLIHFLELPNFLKREDIKTGFEKWMAYFKYEGQEEGIMETIFGDDPIIMKAHNRYVQFTQNDELLEIYEARLKWQLDHSSDITAAEERGEKKGEKKGRREGKEEGIRETAKRMLKKGVPVSDIGEFTGLTVEEVEKISKNNN